MTTSQYWEDRVLVRWMATQHCNYSCWYCRQDHALDQVYKGGIGHWSRAASVAQWLIAFDEAFSGKKLSLIVTGGEPMLDRKMWSLLTHLEYTEYLRAVRIDTNGSCMMQPTLKKAKLMVSYHPTETEFEPFARRVTALTAMGWDVSMVNVVFKPGDPLTLPYVDGIPINVLPAFGEGALFTPRELDWLRTVIPEFDWPRRIGQETRGLPCVFPSAAYEMLPDGRLNVGCMLDAGNLLKGELPERPRGPVACPHRDCYCTDKYSFLGDVTDPLPITSVVRRLI